MPLQVGITGGIGSGKSLCSHILNRLGIPWYSSDLRGKHLLDNDPIVNEQVAKLFPSSVFNGRIDKKQLAALIFSSSEKRVALEGIVHPAVGADYARWLLQHKDEAVVLKEAALLIQSGSYKQLDELIVVTAPEELRVKRVVDRDKATLSDIRARIASQLSQNKMIVYATTIVVNDGESPLLPQLLHLMLRWNLQL